MLVYVERLNYMAMCRRGIVEVSHLQFADIIILFLLHNERLVNNALLLVQNCERIYRLHINLNKSGMARINVIYQVIGALVKVTGSNRLPSSSRCSFLGTS